MKVKVNKIDTILCPFYITDKKKVMRPIFMFFFKDFKRPSVFDYYGIVALLKYGKWQLAGRNTPQKVKNVHTLCAFKPDSDGRVIICLHSA